MEIVLTVVLFAVCMGSMALGLMMSGRELRGSCGGPDIHDANGDALSCGACPKKEQEICPSDDPLIALAQIANPNPRHHH